MRTIEVEEGFDDFRYSIEFAADGRWAALSRIEKLWNFNLESGSIAKHKTELLEENRGGPSDVYVHAGAVYTRTEGGEPHWRYRLDPWTPASPSSGASVTWIPAAGTWSPSCVGAGGATALVKEHRGDLRDRDGNLN
ncbi:MAG TPA: hypothetical protein VNC50_04075, partial [Planctomycetia bacterium]|nr:hypothetical protein [Planctomycetia bacterium]